MTTAHRPRLRRGLLTLVGAIGVTTLALAGCAGGSTSGPEALTFLKNAENTTTEPVLQALADGECAAQQEVLPLEVSSVPQADLDAQVQLLASQNGLPVMFSAGGNPAEGAKLWDQGVILDLDKALTDLGVKDKIAPGAISTIEKLYGGAFNFLPFQYNIEGIFYNTALFEENGWEVPTTWGELTALAADVQAAGYTPFSASGEQGWPLTRLVSGYLFRSLGGPSPISVPPATSVLTSPRSTTTPRPTSSSPARPR